ncbi:MAG: CPBP family intramembrane metalloprotease [Anaerolineae bacterium]|nr:CPBP family intramembrane metalloprotease [Anaerolineae bacterium]
MIISTQNRLSYLRHIAPIIPYVAVLMGLFIFQSAWVSIALYHLGMIIVLWFTRSWYLGQPIKTWHDVIVLIFMIFISFTAGVFIYWLWPLLKLAELLLTTELSDLGLSGLPWLIFIVYYFTVNPILEELFWRGYLGSPSHFVVLNDIWFAGYHVLVLLSFIQAGWIVFSFLILVGTAWLWRQLARRHRGLIIPIASHAAADASIIGAVYLLARLV